MNNDEQDQDGIIQIQCNGTIYRFRVPGEARATRWVFSCGVPSLQYKTAQLLRSGGEWVTIQGEREKK